MGLILISQTAGKNSQSDPCDMLYHYQTFLGQSAKMKGDYAEEMGMSIAMAIGCPGTWAQPAQSHPLPDLDLSKSASSLQPACLGLCLLWPQCDGPAGFANRISVFALPPGTTAEAAGIPLLRIMPTSVAHSKRDLSQHCLLQPPAASISFSDGWGPICVIFPKTARLQKAGWGRNTQVFPFTRVAQKVHFQGLKGTRKQQEKKSKGRRNQAPTLDS